MIFMKTGALFVSHVQFRGQKVAERRSFDGIKIPDSCFVYLALVGDEKHFCRIIAVFRESDAVSFFQLLLVVAAQGYKGDFFEISFLREQYPRVVIFDKVVRSRHFDFIVADQLRFARFGIFLFDLQQLARDLGFQLEFVAGQFFKRLDLFAERFAFPECG